jgi:hypothetical protein
VPCRRSGGGGRDRPPALPNCGRSGDGHAAGGEAIAEGVVGGWQLGQRRFEQRHLLKRGLVQGAIGIGGVGFLLDEELEAARIGPDDAEAAAIGLVLVMQRLETGSDERLPQLHLGGGARVAVCL